MSKLTQREATIAQHLCIHGNTSKEIARVIGGSYRTVEVHRASILRKLGAKTSAQAGWMLALQHLKGDSNVVSPMPSAPRLDVPQTTPQGELDFGSGVVLLSKVRDRVRR